MQTRRELLVSSASVVAATMTAAPSAATLMSAAGPQDQEIRRLIERWEMLNQELTLLGSAVERAEEAGEEARSRELEDEVDRLFDRCWDVHQAIWSAPAESLAGLRLKLSNLAKSYQWQDCIGNREFGDADPVATAIADLERITAGLVT